MRLLWALCLVVLGAVIVGTASAQTSSALPGRILFVKDGDLWVQDANGARQLATGGTFSQPSWSPDGKLIAFVSDKTSTFPTLWLMNAADGSGRRALATPGLQQEDVDSLAWSPDGSQLAVTLFNEPGPTQIALVPLGATGRQTARVLTDLPGGALDPAWSPDGTWLGFAGRDGFAVEMYAVRPDGTSLTRLTVEGQLARSPSWSPDGRHVAFLSNKTGYFEVWVVDIQPDSSGALVASQPRQLTQDLHVDAVSGLSWGR